MTVTAAAVAAPSTRMAEISMPFTVQVPLVGLTR